MTDASVTEPDPSVQQFLAELAHQRRASDHTVAAYRRDLAVLQAGAGTRPLATLQSHDLRRQAMRLHGQGLAARSVARTLSAWRSYYRWLARRGELAADPCVGLRAPKRPRALPKALAIEQTAALLAMPDDGVLVVRDHAMFELFYSSGLRLSELAALDLDGKLDLAGAEVTVTGKRGKTRTVPVGAQARQLQGVVQDGILGLQNLVSGLHPPQLDDFGLLPTLRWYADEVKERLGLTVTISSRGDEAELPVDVRTVLFRVVQESLTNVIRHAKTDKAEVLVVFDEDEVRIRVEDSGRGFNVYDTLRKTGHPCWGLLGMIERATLIGGECHFASQPGLGTIMEVLVPLKERKNGENSAFTGG